MNHELLKIKLTNYKKTLESIQNEPNDEQSPLGRKVSVSGIRLYNLLAREFNAMALDFQMPLFSENTSPSSLTHPKPQELLYPVNTALDLLNREAERQIWEASAAQVILPKGQAISYETQTLLPENQSPSPEKQSKIFISHSSRDIPYVKAIVELLEALGLNDKQIFCSSFPEYGIPNGEDIYDYLKKQFHTTNLLVLFVLSENYYKSAVCLNEMGAAWILQKAAFSILLPDFSIENAEGVVTKNRIAIRLSASRSELVPRLTMLKEQLEAAFHLNPLHSSIWYRKLEQFLERISAVKTPLSTNGQTAYRRRILKAETIGGHTFYLLDERLPLSDIPAQQYAEGETHWLADWNGSHATLLAGKSEISFVCRKIAEPKDYIHNGTMVKNARNITGDILDAR